jgi:hypothetical protein
MVRNDGKQQEECGDKPGCGTTTGVIRKSSTINSTTSKVAVYLLRFENRP